MDLWQKGRELRAVGGNVMKLRISEKLALPLDAVTQKFAILGRTGSGKSYCATKLCEEMLEAKAQVIALDPVGVWYGLRVGQRDVAGFSIPIFGGLHGDVPLEPGAGEFIANLIVDRGISAVLDVSQFESDAQKARFAKDFATRFFFRKKSSPSAVHLFLEEAQEFVPQNPQRDEALMLHAFHRIAKLGRNFGIGATLITQRPQEVNKKALNQTECLFAFQMTGPQERKAIESWIAEKGVNEDIVSVLPHLKIGTCHVWSPQWLKISETITIARKKTADVSSTPTSGAKRAEPKELSHDELVELTKSMAATVERAKAEDPRELKKQIADFRLRIADLEKAKPSEKSRIEIKRVEVPVLKDAQIARLEKVHVQIVEEFTRATTHANALLARVDEVLQPLRDAVQLIPNFEKLTTPGLGQRSGSARARANEVDGAHQPAGLAPRSTQLISNVPRQPAAAPQRSASLAATGGARGAGENEMTRPMQRILDALASLEALGLAEVDKSNAAVFADQSPTSSGYTNNLGRLRSLGLIHYPHRGGLALTDSGRNLAQSDGSIRTREDLHRAWFAKLPSPKVRILEKLIAAYPDAIEKAQLAELAGQSPTSSGYTNNLGNLRSLGLVDYPQQGFVAATALLFPAAL